MTMSYRIRAYTPSGLSVFQMSFPTSTDVNAYWDKLFADQAKALNMFGKIGYVILCKEHLTEGGNWEADMVTPVEVTE